MSTKVSSPNAKGASGFLWGLIALVVIIIAVIGYIVWNGQSAKTQHLAERGVADTSMTIKYDEADAAIVLSSKDAGKDVKTFDIYEDFSCPHCAELAEASDADMKKAVEAGEINVAIHPLNFLDGKDYDNETGHSTRASAATIAAAKAGDVRTYWNLRANLFKDQKDVYDKWQMSDFADAAKELGADSSLVGAIKDADLKELGGKPAGHNAKVLEDKTGKVSSPRILLDGKDFLDGDVTMQNWVEKAKAE